MDGENSVGRPPPAPAHTMNMPLVDYDFGLTLAKTFT